MQQGDDQLHLHACREENSNTIVTLTFRQDQVSPGLAGNCNSWLELRTSIPPSTPEYEQPSSVAILLCSGSQHKHEKIK
jgi:hypothetical protein